MTVEQILQQMRDYTAAWRAQGITQIPIAWIDYWAQQLELVRPYRPYAPYAYDPFWMPGLLRPAGTIQVEVSRHGFPFRVFR